MLIVTVHCSKVVAFVFISARSLDEFVKGLTSGFETQSCWIFFMASKVVLDLNPVRPSGCSFWLKKWWMMDFLWLEREGFVFINDYIMFLAFRNRMHTTAVIHLACASLLSYVFLHLTTLKLETSRDKTFWIIRAHSPPHYVQVQVGSEPRRSPKDRGWGPVSALHPIQLWTTGCFLFVLANPRQKWWGKTPF